MTILAIQTFCRELAPILKMVGTLLTIFKVSLPLILIIVCIKDLALSVISKKPEDVKKRIINCTKSVLFSLLVYFVPTICMLAFSFVTGFNNITENSGIDFDVCYDCMFRTDQKKCNEAIKYSELSR